MSHEKLSKDEIADFAIREVRNSGYENVALRTLAKNMNRSTGIIYSHFNSRKHLYTYIIKYIMNTLACEKLISTNEGSAKENVIKLCTNYIHWYLEDPNIVSLLIKDNELNISRGDWFSFSIVKETINLLLKLKLEENLEFDEQTLFIQLLASLNGYIFLLNYGIVSYDSQYVIKTVENLIQ